MKKIFTILLLACIIFKVNGQTKPFSKKLSEIGSPSNPAFSLMGFLPKEINKPKSLDQLEATMINSFVQNGNFTIPKNFGLEVMPYWLKSHPEKIFDSNALAKTEIAPLENLALSLCSVNENIGDSLFNSKIGFGFRTLIFSGKIEKTKLNDIKKYRDLYAAEVMEILPIFAAMESIKANNIKTYNDYFEAVRIEFKDKIICDSTANIKYWEYFFNKYIPKEKWNNIISPDKTINQITEEIEKIIDDKLNDTTIFTKQLAARIQELQVRKYGFFLEVAAATFLDFPKGDIGFSKIPKFGIWSTATYCLPNQHFNFIATVRYIRDYQIEKSTTNYDYGGSIEYIIDKISLSGELLQRTQSSLIERTLMEDGFELRKTRIRYDYRATFNLSYRLSESIILNYTFGKSFDYTDTKSKNIINMLSVNIGFGNVPLTLF